MTPHDLLANFEVLAEAPNGIQRLRELVLELAVRGKLVEQNAADEPASELLKRARLEKAKCSKATTPIKQTSPIDLSELAFELPGGWAWARMDEFCDLKSGVTKGRNLQGVECTEFPYLRVANVQAGYTDLRVLKTIPLPLAELEVYRLQQGDVLLTEGGDWDKLGRSAVWLGEIDPCIHQNHIFRARILGSAIQPRWLSGFTNSPDGRAHFQSCSKQTTNLASINMTQLKSCPVPIPPGKEQVRILARVDELMTLLERLEAKRQEREAARTTARDSALAALRDAPTPDDVEVAWLRIQERFEELFTRTEDVDRLRQSILQLGLRGSLLSQDPEPGSAGILLDRIRRRKGDLIKERKFRSDVPAPAVDTTSEPFQIPTGWRWCRLKDLLGMVTSGSRSWKAHYSTTGAAFIRSQDIKKDRLEYDDRAFVNPPTGAEGMRTLVEVGDLLITITGANVGKCALIGEDPGEAYVSQHVALLKLISPEIGPYLHLWLTSEFAGRGLLLGTSYGAKPGLNLDAIRNLLVAVPPEAQIEKNLMAVSQMLTICDRLSVALKTATEQSREFAAAAIQHLDL